jgi:hypothetical protein
MSKAWTVSLVPMVINCSLLVHVFVFRGARTAMVGSSKIEMQREPQSSKSLGGIQGRTRWYVPMGTNETQAARS